MTCQGRLSGGVAVCQGYVLPRRLKGRRQMRGQLGHSQRKEEENREDADWRTPSNCKNVARDAPQGVEEAING